MIIIISFTYYITLTFFFLATIRINEKREENSIKKQQNI